MALFHAIGLGVAIIVLRILAPEIWSALENFAVDSISLAGEIVSHLQTASAGFSLPPI